MTKHFIPALEYGRKNAAGERVDDQAEFKAVMNALTERDQKIKEFAEKASAEIKANGTMAAETKAALEKIAGNAAGLQARLLDVEQKLGRRAGPSSDNGGPSIGAQFTGTDEFRVLQARGKGSARMSVKAVTSITSATTGTGGVGDAIRPSRQPGIIAPPDRQMTVRDLVMPGRTDSNAVEYVKETGFQNMAAPVAEGALKPQSDLSFDLVTTPVRTLAHWFLASKQVLADIPLLQSYMSP